MSIFDDLSQFKNIPAYLDAYGKYNNVKSKVEAYFQNAKPGSTIPWVNGTLTLDNNGVAHYISNSDPSSNISFTATTPIEQIYNSSPEVAASWVRTYGSDPIGTQALQTISQSQNQGGTQNTGGTGSGGTGTNAGVGTGYQDPNSIPGSGTALDFLTDPENYLDSTGPFGMPTPDDYLNAMKDSVERKAIVESFSNALGAYVQGVNQSANALKIGNQSTQTILDSVLGQTNQQLAEGQSNASNILSQNAADAINTYSSGGDAAKQAITDSSAAAETGLVDATNLGIQAANQGFGTARGDITNATNLSDAAIRQGTQGALAGINQGYDTARNDILGARNLSEAALTSGTEGAIGRFDPYANYGTSAAKLEADLTGVNGPEAQAAAFKAYKESPGQEYLRNQMEQSLLRNAAATGGLGSGNVLTALQENAYGLASQDFQQNLANIRSIANTGMTAAENQAAYQMQGGSNLSNLYQTSGQNLSGLAAQRGESVGGLLSNQGTNLANLYSTSGTQLAELAAQNGMTVSEYLNALGVNLGNVRTAAGQNLAGIEQNTAQNVAGTQSNLGTNLANLAYDTSQQQAYNTSAFGQTKGALTQDYYNNLAGLFGSGSSDVANIYTGLGTTLGNYNLGQSTNATNMAVANAQLAAQRGANSANIWGSALGALGSVGTALVGGLL